MRRRARRGIAIIVVLLVISIMAVVAAAITTMGSNGLGIVNSQSRSQAALYAAEAGAWYAAKRFAADNSFSEVPETAMPNVDATYRVKITGPGPVAGPKGAIPADAYYILSTGRSGTGTERQVGLLVQVSKSAYNFAGFADQSILLDNDSQTDTWNSSLGLPYPAGAVTGLAHLGTNATNKDAVKILNGSTVDGAQANIYVGPGAAPDVVSDASAGSYNAVIAMNQNFNMPAVDLDGYAKEDFEAAQDITTPAPLIDDPADEYDALGFLIPGVYKDVKVDGWELKLKPGATYYFHKLNVEGGGTIFLVPTATEEVTVKVFDTVIMEGGSVVNQTHIPALLNFEVSEGGLGVKLEGGAEAYYVAKAPKAEVIVENGDLYGSVICKKLKLDASASIHYDLSLGTLLGGGSTNLKILSNQRF